MTIRRSRSARLSLIVAALAATSPATAADPTVAGDYACKVDCHRSDAPPSIEIEGTVAVCRNDLGGVFRGRVLGPARIACFNMVGALSPDGTRLEWSNGGVWERRH